MYRCEDYSCNHLFEEPQIEIMHHSELEGYHTEAFDSCPACGMGYEEVYECRDCGEYKFSWELDRDGSCADGCEEEVA